MSRRQVGWAVMAIGLAMLVLVGRRAVGQPPLYDGVVIEDPYRYLEPTASAPGDPSSGSASLPLDAGVSPAIYVGTTENPPQAQLIIDRGAVALPAGTTALDIRIEPVQLPAPMPSGLGTFVGNAYRFSVTNQAGVAAALRAGSTATVVLRAPAGVTEARIVRQSGAGWVSLATDNAGLPDLFSTNASALGIFAVARTGLSGSGSPGAASPGPVPSTPPNQPSPGGGIGAPVWIAVGLLGAALLLGIWYLRDVAREGPRR